MRHSLFAKHNSIFFYIIEMTYEINRNTAFHFLYFFIFGFFSPSFSLNVLYFLIFPPIHEIFKNRNFFICMNFFFLVQFFCCIHENLFLYVWTFSSYIHDNSFYVCGHLFSYIETFILYAWKFPFITCNEFFLQQQYFYC
jgi:hypothetical protein